MKFIKRKLNESILDTISDYDTFDDIVSYGQGAFKDLFNSVGIDITNMKTIDQDSNGDNYSSIMSQVTNGETLVDDHGVMLKKFTLSDGSVVYFTSDFGFNALWW